jgi:hypothetical protein
MGISVANAAAIFVNLAKTNDVDKTVPTLSWFAANFLPQLRTLPIYMLGGKYRNYNIPIPIATLRWFANQLDDTRLEYLFGGSIEQMYSVRARAESIYNDNRGSEILDHPAAMCAEDLELLANCYMRVRRVEHARKLLRISDHEQMVSEM